MTVPTWDSVVFALIFQKIIENVKDIEKICNIAKLRKNLDKNDRVPTFSKFLDGHALDQ